MNEAELLLKLSMEFNAKAMVRCSKACVTSVKSAAPTDAERTCMENCLARHAKAIHEGLTIMSNMGSGAVPGPK